MKKRLPKARYEQMLPHEIVKRRKKFPAAFIGMGGLEWHGQHLAVGNDALKADRLCGIAAEKSGGFAFPVLWYGEPRLGGIMELNAPHGQGIMEEMEFKSFKFKKENFGKSQKEQIKAYQDLIYHVLVQLRSLEMKAVCILTGHYPLYDWITPVVKKFNGRFRDIRVFVGNEFHYANDSRHVGADHAGKWETSYLMHLRPECVDMGVFRDKSIKPVGVWGEDPRGVSSPALGEKACNLIVSGMIRKARELLRKE